MSYDADYYRARAIEERDRAESADRVYLARLHRELAQQLDRRADECDGEITTPAMVAATDPLPAQRLG